ncbi:6-phosphofructokinase [Bradymonas sediminis]|uniref:6-phosphofructokinase n=1 Tax=Bradymonas sediminis TaxID=1548548 RepID=A0A2Z4FRX2_9DELT|nr:6-phosphofructokinase [Bradymonas sediminis]
MKKPETNKSQSRPKRLAVLASGGPAPGINSVISAVTIEAINRGWEVLGVKDGYRGLVDDDMKQLSREDVDWIHFRGGAVLGMSRTSPVQGDNLEKIVATIKRRGIDFLVTIGGDGTAFGASFIAAETGGVLRCAHVPKTIDNDLPLPEGVPSFGYTTACHVGVGMVQNLIIDAQTTRRWHLVTTMGRQAGHLAIGIGKASGAHLTLIPEEFGIDGATVDKFVSIIEGAVIKGRAEGRHWGLAVIGEGLVGALKASELEKLPDAGRDSFGNIRLANVALGTILCDQVTRRLAERGIDVAMREIKLGYELRCADPVPFDIEYTRDLGYGAVRFLADGGTNAIVVVDHKKRTYVPFEHMRDPKTGRPRVRNVDINSENYHVARRYMQRLGRRDFADPQQLARLAAAANTTPEAFKSEFERLVCGEPMDFDGPGEKRELKLN